MFYSSITNCNQSVLILLQVAGWTAYCDIKANSAQTLVSSSSSVLFTLEKYYSKLHDISEIHEFMRYKYHGGAGCGVGGGTECFLRDIVREVGSKATIRVLTV